MKLLETSVDCSVQKFEIKCPWCLVRAHVSVCMHRAHTDFQLNMTRQRCHKETKSESQRATYLVTCIVSSLTLEEVRSLDC